VFEYEGTPEVWVPIGSLDHPEDWPLVKDADWGETMHYHVDSKVPWLKIDDGLNKRSTEHTPFRDEAARFPLDKGLRPRAATRASPMIKEQLIALYEIQELKE
jgi:hypothetical protein